MSTPVTPVQVNQTHVPFKASEPGTRAALAVAHHTVVAARLLPTWVVTENPSDLPGLYVARLHASGSQGVLVTGIAVTDATLQGVRDALPAGLVRMPPMDLDEPHIVETWL